MANMATRISIYADDKDQRLVPQGRRRSGLSGKKIDALNAGARPAERFAGLGASAIGFGARSPRQAAAFETARGRRHAARHLAQRKRLKADIAGLRPGWVPGN